MSRAAAILHPVLARSLARASLPLATAAVAVLALGLKLATLVPLPVVAGLGDLLDRENPAGHESPAGLDAGEIDEALLLAAEPAAGPPPADGTAERAGGPPPANGAAERAGGPPAGGNPAEHAAGPDADGTGKPPGCPASVAGLEDVAEDLMQRRERIDGREGRLEIREAALAEAEAQLAKRAEELEQIRQQVEQQIARLTAGDDARIAQLVKVYEAMKPKQAAEVFDRLELELLTRVASRIREAKMAAILAAMDPEKARRVTIELARRLSPRPEPNSG